VRAWTGVAVLALATVARAADAPALSFTPQDRAVADKLVKQKDAEIRKWSIPGIVTFTLGQTGTLPEDSFVYALVKCYHATGFLASPPFADGCVRQLAAADKTMSRWKQRAVRQFWAEYVRMRRKNPAPRGPKHIAADFLMYLDTKYACRADRINRRLEAFVKAEEHWRKVMNDWQKWEDAKTEREQRAREAREKQLLKNFVDFWATKHTSG
jgi:hypothetical protein